MVAIALLAGVIRQPSGRVPTTRRTDPCQQPFSHWATAFGVPDSIGARAQSVVAGDAGRGVRRDVRQFARLGAQQRDGTSRQQSSAGACPISTSPWVTRGRCRRVRPLISCRFAMATMSDGRIANCYCLLRFVNLRRRSQIATRTGVGPCHERDRRSPWLSAGRAIEIRSTELT